jgi:hypothetical protein
MRATTEMQPRQSAAVAFQHCYAAPHHTSPSAVGVEAAAAAAETCILFGAWEWRCSVQLASVERWPTGCSAFEEHTVVCPVQGNSKLGLDMPPLAGC